jgi:tyrosinase
VVVNVFVNCPYLSPDTPYSDPHYAGTFSFFGAPKMEGMPGMAGPTYVVDITTAVREAGFAPDKINVQFMSVPAAAGAKSSATFKVGKIEILGA